MSTPPEALSQFAQGDRVKEVLPLYSIEPHELDSCLAVNAAGLCGHSVAKEMCCKSCSLDNTNNELLGADKDAGYGDDPAFMMETCMNIASRPCPPLVDCEKSLDELADFDDDVKNAFSIKSYASIIGGLITGTGLGPVAGGLAAFMFGAVADIFQLDSRIDSKCGKFATDKQDCLWHKVARYARVHPSPRATMGPLSFP